MKKITYLLLFSCFLAATYDLTAQNSDVKELIRKAEQGDAETQYSLGECYYKGKCKDIKQNYEEAVHWFRKAAEQGLDKAQFRLGACYGGGFGLKQNYEQAEYWQIKATEKGNADIQSDLGNSYYYGACIIRDPEKAVYWYTKAAEQENANAQYGLGNCFHYGHGVKTDFEKAAYWYAKAAEQGHIDAQKKIGTFYYKGLGVVKDNKQAVYWWQKAAKQGDEFAQRKIKDCEKEINREQSIGKEWGGDLVLRAKQEPIDVQSKVENKPTEQKINEFQDNFIIEEELLSTLYEEIQTLFDQQDYDPQTAISLINEYLELTSANDVNRGELLNTLGLLYVNTGDTSHLFSTINSLKTYDADLPQSEWKDEISTLEQKYDELSKINMIFDEHIVGCWVSDRYNSEATPHLIVYIQRDKNNQFIASSLSIKSESPYLSSFNDNEKRKIQNSQSFYLDGNAKTLRAISGTENLNIGTGELETMIMSTFVNELGNNLRDYFRKTDKSFMGMGSTMKNVGVSLGVELLGGLIKEASVSKKIVKVHTFDLRQDINKKLTGKIIKTTYTMRSDMDAILQENEEVNVKFAKVKQNDKIIFASSEGVPIYLGGATENDYQNSELWNINQQYKRNNNKKKAVIREYNGRMYNKLGWFIR